METAYIEVLGESSYIEEVVRFPLSVDVEIVVPLLDSAEIAGRFADLDDRFTSAVAGFRKSFTSVEHGGTRVREVYVDKKEKMRGMERRYLFVATSPEVQERLISTVGTIRIKSGENISVAVRQPLFEPDPKAVAKAHGEAIQDASARAAVVAEAAGGEVGVVIHARQLAFAKRSSGAFGDSDWWGGSDRFSESFHIGSVGRGELNTTEPTRTIFVRYLVRFGLEKGGKRRKIKRK